MRTLNLRYGKRFYLKHGWMELSFTPNSIALPLSVFWIDQGKGFEKGFLIRVLCFDFVYNNGKVPF